MIKYEQNILTAFKVLGYEPRDNQVSIINDVIVSFLDKKNKNVILSAPTGVGKSIIAAVISEVLSSKEDKKLAGIFLSSTNSLTLQYADSFKDLSEMKFFRVKGAASYNCNYFNKKGNAYATGEDCVKKELSDLEINKFCTNCEYKAAQLMINKTENLITNYAYFMISKLKSDHLLERNLQVFDEAHLLNDVFCSQVSIEFSVELFDKLTKDLKNDLNGKLDNEIADLVLFKQNLIQRKITESNYMEKLNELYKLYINIAKKCMTQAALIPDMKVKTKIRKIGTRFGRLASLIGSLFDYKYDHVFDNTIKDTISVKPIFVGDMMHLLLGKYNLFMTATMSLNFAQTTMKLNPNETDFITVDPVFPPSNKPLFFLGKENLNYQKMSEKSTFVELGKIIELIIENHSKDKGIIIVPSFYAGKSIINALPNNIKIFEHVQGNNSSGIIEEFKQHKGPGVLISPSIFEGLDLKDDQSRYQIILKNPFPSLGDIRMKKIADCYSTIYREITLYKILQGIGRSVRSKEDHACSYFLDKSSETLFKSKLNLWQNQFSIIK